MCTHHTFLHAPVLVMASQQRKGVWGWLRVCGDGGGLVPLSVRHCRWSLSRPSALRSRDIISWLMENPHVYKLKEMFLYEILFFLAEKVHWEGGRFVVQEEVVVV